MVGTILENGLEGELEEEPGYSKYDYRNKQTDNSRNGYTEKTFKTSLGDMEITIPRDRKNKYDPQLVKKPTTLSDDIEPLNVRQGNDYQQSPEKFFYSSCQRDLFRGSFFCTGFLQFTGNNPASN